MNVTTSNNNTINKYPQHFIVHHKQTFTQNPPVGL